MPVRATSGRLAVLAGWCWVTGTVITIVTQVAGYTGNKYLAAFHALTPHLLGASLVVAVGAALVRRRSLAGAAAAAVVVLVALSWSVLFPGGQPSPMAGATPLRVFQANLLYSNTAADDFVPVIAGLDVDVLTFTEYTPAHAAALHGRGDITDEFPYRIERPATNSDGVALWSRYPLDSLGSLPTVRSTMAVVRGPEPVVVVIVHAHSPLASVARWERELDQIATLDNQADGGRLVVGDFNATHWNPPFRRLLGHGWRDAHEQRGRGLVASWPADRLVPALIRIDHALVDDGLVVDDVYDVDMPGSDHRAFVVTITPAQR